MRDPVKQDSNTKHIKITVKANGGGYTAEYDPKVINVDENDMILSFRLVTPTPDDVVIDNVTITPLGQTQLSQPSISSNGKHMVLTDSNTEKQTFHLDFTYRNKKGSALSIVRAKCDDNVSDYPIVDNNPPGSPMSMTPVAPEKAQMSDYPIVDNNPPG